MPSESVAEFYDLARRERLAPPGTLDALAADPSLPQANLGALAAALAERSDLPAGLAPLIDEAKTGTLATRPPADELPVPTFEPPPAPAMADMVDAALDEHSSDSLAAAFVPEEYVPDGVNEFASESHDEMALAADRPAPRPVTPEADAHTLRLWLGVAAGLWVLAIAMWLVYIYKPFSSAPEEKPARSRPR